MCIRKELGREKVLAQNAQAYFGPAPDSAIIPFVGLSSSSAAASETRLALALSASTSIPLIAWSRMSVSTSICALRFRPLPACPEPSPSEQGKWMPGVPGGVIALSCDTLRGGQPVIIGPADCASGTDDSESELLSRGIGAGPGVEDLEVDGYRLEPIATPSPELALIISVRELLRKAAC